MTLHIFNPEHDIALASGLSNFTAPHAARQLRHDLCYLPSLWAGPADAVLVDDVEQALHAARRWKPQAQFVSKHQLRHLPIDRIEPWGWNSALRAFLLRYGVEESLLPTETMLSHIRALSHRRTAAGLLSRLCTIGGTVGEAVECTTPEAVDRQLQAWGRAVIKAPWSSSGRGVRYAGTATAAPDSVDLCAYYTNGWLRNVIARQGSIMVEPYYKKVKDFGMEFFADGKGGARYEGLSLFHTDAGAYTGNVLATEQAKRQQLLRFISGDVLEAVQQTICQTMGEACRDKYCGPFGVDMMVVADRSLKSEGGSLTSSLIPHPSSFILHPCVEINLRRTMGHVAIALEQRLNAAADDEVCHTMRIACTDDNYKLIITKT